MSYNMKCALHCYFIQSRSKNGGGGGALFVYKLNISFMIVYCVGRYKDEQGLFCNISVGFISL